MFSYDTGVALRICHDSYFGMIRDSFVCFHVGLAGVEVCSSVLFHVVLCCVVWSCVELRSVVLLAVASCLVVVSSYVLRCVVLGSIESRRNVLS